MSFKLSESSKQKLSTCDERLQNIFNQVIGVMDCTILYGHRTKEEQEEAVKRGVSNLHFPKSKHNSVPSLAVDVAPCPINWQDRDSFHKLAALVKGISDGMGIKIRWGGDWNMNGIAEEKGEYDLPHFEIVE